MKRGPLPESRPFSGRRLCCSQYLNYVIGKQSLYSLKYSIYPCWNKVVNLSFQLNCLLFWQRWNWFLTSASCRNMLRVDHKCVAPWLNTIHEELLSAYISTHRQPAHVCAWACVRLRGEVRKTAGHVCIISGRFLSNLLMNRFNWMGYYF